MKEIDKIDYEKLVLEVVEKNTKSLMRKYNKTNETQGTKSVFDFIDKVIEVEITIKNKKER